MHYALIPNKIKSPSVLGSAIKVTAVDDVNNYKVPHVIPSPLRFKGCSQVVQIVIAPLAVI